MTIPKHLLEDLGLAVRRRPDDVLLEVGAGGELVVARLRMAIAALLVLLPPLNYYTGGTVHESLTGVAGAVMLLLLSQVWVNLARRAQRPPWLPAASAAFDVSMVTLVLALLALEQPVAALNSFVVWVCYPLAIFATALRQDIRVCLFAGALAIVQSSVLWLVVYGSASEPLVSAAYGTATVGTQLQRMVLLAAITALTAIVVYRSQALTRVSTTDGLTGLPNRTWLNTRMPHQVVRARSEGRTLTLALVDLDHFRRINAELGHLAGDRALAHAVQVLQRGLGHDEAMIRAGGEEFVLLLPLPLGAAWERMEALRRRLEAHPFEPSDGSEPRSLTLSAGLAGIPQDAVDLSGLMKRADQRLRAAKAAGRNRVVARDAG